MTDIWDTDTLDERLAHAERRIAELEQLLSAQHRGAVVVTKAPEQTAAVDRRTRRDVFKLAGAAAAGMTAMTVLRGQPALAADGGNLVIGQANTGEVQTTLSFDGTAGSMVDNSTSPPTPLPVLDVDATTSATTGKGSGGDAVHGLGDVGQNGVVGLAAGGAGVLGVTSDFGGVVGLSSSATFGSTPDYGVDLVALGNGNIGQFAAPAAAFTNGVPNFLSELATSGGFELLRDSTGGLWSSDASGNFHRMNSVVPLASPVRVVDTRNGTGGLSGPLTPGQTYTSASIVGGTIPGSSIGIVGNLALVASGSSLQGLGFLAIFPGGTAWPGTANVNADEASAISSGVTVGLGTGSNTGKVSLYVGGTSTPAHAVLDVSAYLI